VSAPDTITAMIGRLQAAPEFSGSLVRYGLLAQLPVERERVYLLGTTGFQREPYSGGHTVRRETYDVRGLIEVHQLGTAGAELVIARAWQLVNAIDSTLMDDPDLVSAHYTSDMRVLNDEVVPMTDGWISRLLFRLGMESTL
jgi:hypothetical protein